VREQARASEPWDEDAVAALDRLLEPQPFISRISAAKTFRERVERDARAAREGRVTAARVLQSLAGLEPAG
jgi:3,8-divinyl chlorophyllide a/chlorophyllide a reductase subunit Z